MPEGHTIHRLAREHGRELAGHPVAVSSPQGRFSAGATRLDGRTLVLISHRASLLSLVNRLIVIDQGRVVADGPRDAVLAALAGGKLSVATAH